MSYVLQFEHLLEYDAGKEGITVPVTLSSSQNWVHVEAKFDCGSSYCIFERLYSEMLGLDVETGFPQRIGTAMGSFLTYGHEVTLSVRDYDLEIVAYFAANPNIDRNVLGRHGWLNRFCVGLNDYEGKMFLSRLGADGSVSN